MKQPEKEPAWESVGIRAGGPMRRQPIALWPLQPLVDGIPTDFALGLRFRNATCPKPKLPSPKPDAFLRLLRCGALKAQRVARAPTRSRVEVEA